MKLAYATIFDAEDVLNWSGTPFYMSKAFIEQDMPVEYIGSLKRRLPPFFKIKQTWKKWTSGQRESPRFNTVTAKFYSEQVAARLQKLKVDAVIAPQINPVAYLDCSQPIVLWTDALYSSLIAYNPAFYNHSPASIEQGNKITAECLARCSLALFSSDWAARSALELYGINKEKVKVVPFGANLNCQHTLNDIRDMLKTRFPHTVKLLFLGKRWELKGGDQVIQVAKALHARGQAVELAIVGSDPPKNIEIPDYIKCYGFISKRTPEGIAQITKLLRESHFLFVPTRADAYGIVFCEANAFGLPCLTSYVGGVSTIVKNNVNGMTFALDASPDLYCDYIINLMQNYSRYEEMALNAFHEFETRLNWKVATQTVKKLLHEVI